MWEAWLAFGAFLLSIWAFGMAVNIRGRRHTSTEKHQQDVIGEYRDQLLRALEDNLQLRNEIIRLKHELRLALATQRTVHQVTTSVPKAMLDRMIRLCHPDKHNNSETAKEVTQWLLSQRN